MSGHLAFVVASYAVTSLAMVGLVIWVIADARARRRELAELERSGAGRRNAPAPTTS